MKKRPQSRPVIHNRINQRYYYLMLLPALVYLIIFEFIPMFGLVMAFQNFKPGKGIFHSDWVGLANFKRLFASSDTFELFRNTLVISTGKILVKTFASIVFAILLSEITTRWLKKSVQTITYLPHFVSWVIISQLVYLVLGNDGFINQALVFFGFEPVNFLSSNDTFQGMLIGTHTWKEFGYGSIVYLAAITSVDPGLYEAAALDGANWWQRVRHIMIPAIIPIVVLILARDVSGVLSAGFDQVFNLYNARVYDTGDILDTYIYRVGLQGRQFSLSTALGLFKSVIGIIMMLSVNWLSVKTLKRSIF